VIHGGDLIFDGAKIEENLTIEETSLLRTLVLIDAGVSSVLFILSRPRI
jgi:hypothetical protein